MSSRFRREKSVEKSRTGAEAASHFASTPSPSTKALKIYHPPTYSLIHPLIYGIFPSILQENARTRDTDMSKVKFKLWGRLSNKQATKSW